MMNPKGELQESCQKRGFPCPLYHEIARPSLSQLVRGPPSSFVRSVTIEWEGEQMTEQGTGKSIKLAERLAADKMLERIRLSTGSADSMSAIDPYKQPVLSPTRFKSQLQELVQKSRCGPLPEYDVHVLGGPPHHRVFEATCTVNLNGQGPVQAVGKGSTKREAQSDAAKNMLSKLDSAIDIPVSGLETVDQTETDHEESVDPNIVYRALKDYRIETVNEQGDGGVYLCLAKASGMDLQTPLVACGMSDDSVDDAQTKAKANLAYTIIFLTDTH